jgi:hypothetical protein
MSTLLWKGSRRLRELPETSIEETLEKTTREIEYEGPHSECLAKRPKPGTIEARSGLRIASVRVRRLTGGRGRLILKLDDATDTSGGGGPPTSGLTVELDWVAEQVDLLKHPRYRHPSGTKQLELEDLVNLQSWEAESDTALKKNFQYHKVEGLRTSEVATLSANAQDYATKKLRGQDSFRVYFPCVKRTTKISNPLAGEACGKKLTDLPSGLPRPTGYQWMKTADRSVRSGSGKWERREEWQGFLEIDADIY